MSRSDLKGGAPRAAYRLHRALLAAGRQSTMLVEQKLSEDDTVVGPRSAWGRAKSDLRPGLANVVGRLQRPADAGWRSLALLRSGLARAINRSDADLVNLHWVGEETLSVEEIGEIDKPILWTMHDMWPFCGAEHYAADDRHARWRDGYGKRARAAAAGGLDLDGWVWRRKQKAWRRPFSLVAPSRWLAQCARESSLLGRCPVEVVPNVLDTELFQPLDGTPERRALGIDPDAPVLLYAAAGGTADPRKGWDLLAAALELMASAHPRLVCLILGQTKPGPAPRSRVDLRWLGHVSDDARLAGLYSLADVVVVPSRQENLSQVATEAQSSGCPVVAFATAGMADAVEHETTGYLARAFLPEDLARGISWVIGDRDRRGRLGEQARAKAVHCWSPAAVVPRYVELYRSSLARQGGTST